MKQPLYPHQRSIRNFGLVLAILSLLAILACPLMYWGLNFVSTPEDTPALHGVSDESIRELAREYYQDLRGIWSIFLRGVTEEEFVEMMIRGLRSETQSDVPLGEAASLKLVRPDFAVLPEGITPESTVLDLLNKDRMLFENNRGTFHLLSLVAVLYSGTVAVLMLWMGVSWMRGEPFGRPTLLGLRILGILILVQSTGSLLFQVFISIETFGIFLHYSLITLAPFLLLSAGGTGFPAGILLLILSWVLEHGRALKEEQNLTI